MNVATNHPTLETGSAILEDLDLRGLVCSIIHEYREAMASANRSVTFVDEHPYAIVRADRNAASVALRTILDAIARTTPEPLLVARLYATDEELCVDLSDSAIGPRDAREDDGSAGQATELDLTADEHELARRCLAQSGATLRTHRADAARVFTIAFERASN